MSHMNFKGSVRSTLSRCVTHGLYQHVGEHSPQHCHIYSGMSFYLHWRGKIHRGVCWLIVLMIKDEMILEVAAISLLRPLGRMKNLSVLLIIFFSI